MKAKSNTPTLSMVQLAMFSAIILAMAFIPGLGYIPLGVTRATIIHLPVIIGSLLLGPKKGAFLGGVFGLTSLINNTFSPTVTSFTFSPFYSGGNPWSLVICFVPRILIGIKSCTRKITRFSIRLPSECRALPVPSSIPRWSCR